MFNFKLIGPNQSWYILSDYRQSGICLIVSS